MRDAIVFLFLVVLAFMLKEQFKRNRNTSISSPTQVVAPPATLEEAVRRDFPDLVTLPFSAN